MSAASEKTKMKMGGADEEGVSPSKRFKLGLVSSVNHFGMVVLLEAGTEMRFSACVPGGGLLLLFAWAGHMVRSPTTTTWWSGCVW
jgi:hypothetical protein